MNKLCILTIFIVTCHSALSQSVSEFSYSRCLERNDSSSVSTTLLASGQLSIKLRTYITCSGNFISSVQALSSSVLNIIIGPKPIPFKDSEGNIGEIIELGDCDCLFDFELTVDGGELKDIREVLVNGMTLRQIDSHNLLDPSLEIKD